MRPLMAITEQAEAGCVGGARRPITGALDISIQSAFARQSQKPIQYNAALRRTRGDHFLLHYFAHQRLPPLVRGSPAYPTPYCSLPGLPYHRIAQERRERDVLDIPPARSCEPLLVVPGGFLFVLKVLIYQSQMHGYACQLSRFSSYAPVPVTGRDASPLHVSPTRL